MSNSEKIEIVTQASPEATYEASGIDKLKELVEDYPADEAGEKEIDHDGLEVPKGKIPIDGHFSTDELKQLVDAAKKEGMLSEDVDIVIKDQNEQVGDRVLIRDNSQAST